MPRGQRTYSSLVAPQKEEQCVTIMLKCRRLNTSDAYIFIYYYHKCWHVWSSIYLLSMVKCRKKTSFMKTMWLYITSLQPITAKYILVSNQSQPSIYIGFQPITVKYISVSNQSLPSIYHSFRISVICVNKVCDKNIQYFEEYFCILTVQTFNNKDK